MSLRDNDSEGARRLRESNLEALRSCRLCIICARSNEAVIVQHQLGAEKKLEGRFIEDVASEHEFYLGNLPTEKGDIPYYITSPTRQGIQTFAVQCAALLSVLKTDFAIHLGVCAAIEDGKIK
jgi:hypothetical protein